MATTTSSALGTSVHGSPTRAIRAMVWTLQILLTLAFLAHGLMMLFPPAEVAAQMNATLPRWFSLFIGVAEVAAAAGLTLPAATGIARWLMAWAAGGIVIIMIAATALHIYRNEAGSAMTTFVLLVMATVVARARSRDYPRR